MRVGRTRLDLAEGPPAAENRRPVRWGGGDAAIEPAAGNRTARDEAEKQPFFDLARASEAPVPERIAPMTAGEASGPKLSRVKRSKRSRANEPLKPSTVSVPP